MDFKQGLYIGQRLEQRLVMTQQLQQAIRLLQLSRTELVESIRDSLNENPLLEDQAMQEGGSPSQVTGGEGEVTNMDERPGAERQEIDWQQYFADLARGPSESGGGYRGGDDERPPLSQTLTRASTLSEVLLEQTGMLNLTEMQREIACEIIGNLDDDGYFRPTTLELRGGSDAGRRLLRRRAETRGIVTEELGPTLRLLWLADDEVSEWERDAEGRGLKTTLVTANSTRAIAVEMECTPAEVHTVLEQVRLLEPVGVASRDLRECLLRQATVEHPDDTRLHRLIDRHLHNIENRKHNVIMRDLRAKPEEMRALLELLGTLEPRPGRCYSGDDARYITPDVYVHKVGDEYTVVVNEDGLPRLRVSNFYKHALSDTHGKEAKEYLQEKMRQAVWMIRSIHQRQSTIQRVTESIMRFQRTFLDGGIAFLRPLVLRQVAEDCGLHESTVSRVTTSKYVHTPQGIFELKYFFNSRITTDTGHDMASEAVKHAIGQLIDKEQPGAPLSDQELAEILKGEWERAKLLSRLDCEEGEIDALLPSKSMSIARRTVAKYREAMNIQSSSRRRRMF